VLKSAMAYQSKVGKPGFKRSEALIKTTKHLWQQLKEASFFTLIGDHFSQDRRFIPIIRRVAGI